MVLTIDKKRIDITLEEEELLSEVVENIDKWLKESQLIIEKLYVNNEDFSKKDLNIKVDEINTIDIETLSFTDLNVNNLTWVNYFFEKLTLAVVNWDENSLSQVEVEIPYILNQLPTLLSIDNKTPDNVYVDILDKQLKKYSYFKCKEDFVDKNELIPILNSISTLLKERIREFTNTREELKISANVLCELNSELENVSTYLQSGKYNEASLIMNKFTNLFHKVIRMLEFNINNEEIVKTVELKDFTEGLNDILSELLDGYESQDTVLIGDILEYEISPRLETLKNIII